MEWYINLNIRFIITVRKREQQIGSLSSVKSFSDSSIVLRFVDERTLHFCVLLYLEIPQALIDINKVLKHWWLTWNVNTWKLKYQPSHHSYSAHFLGSSYITSSCLEKKNENLIKDN